MNRKNFRERRKKIIACFGAFVVISVISLTVAYAALSDTLKITGSAGVQAANWNVYLKSLSAGSLNNVESYEEPTISGSGIGTYSVVFSKSGGMIMFNYQVMNDGDYNAKLDSVINSTPVCTSDIGNEEDEINVCNNISVDVKWNSNMYEDSFNAGDVVSTEERLCFNGDNSTWRDSYLTVTVRYDATAETLPSSNVTISNLSHEFIFSPTDQKCEYDPSSSPYAGQ